MQFKAKNKLVFLAKQSSKRQNSAKLSFGQHPLSTYEVVGSWSNVSLPFCTEVCKKLILSVIEGVKANLEDGNCFEKFDENNLVVGPSGKVMFKHVRFFPTTYEAKRAMWKNTHDFIESLFGEKTIPKDIEHLLSLINKQTKVLLYTVHPSLESHSERGWCFTKMYEHIKFKITAAQKNMILMKVPYHEKWRTIANQNAVLHETINFIYSNYGRLPKFNEKGVLYTEIEIQLHEAEMFLDSSRSVLEVTMKDMKLLEMCDGD
ncbi:hypothetical protein OsI_38564 [Oryza sativa Indica Group]|uniref:Uncharacterized protein n=2 Tax=Oryza TaxID=4527 RepID=B8BM89_ORYSI|nr:hypothetical protein OsI_38564 [Oryza sativa Indica Group]